jgi:hypothetical protein
VSEKSNPKKFALPRTVPPKFKHVYDAAWRVELTFRERLKVLFGYNIDMKLRLYMEHSAEHRALRAITPRW